MPVRPYGHRGLVVIGASAGGVETLKHVVSGLPSDLPAAVCIVLHLAPDSPSALAAILARAGTLACHTARDGDGLRDGRILVAPPDRHLIIDDSVVRLSIGPRENNHRPAVDALFRSAAWERGADVVGVILSGTRDDGTAGLAVIKAQGGAAVVQDPEEALYPGMPASAIANVAVDAIVPSTGIAKAIVEMVNGASLPDGPPSGGGAGPPETAGTDVTICPECGGVLSEIHETGATQWRCRVGHRYSPESLVDAQATDIEAALWAAVRALNDRTLLLQRMSDQLQSRGQIRSARRFRRRADQAEEQAKLVRHALAQAAQTTLTEAGGEDDDAQAQQGVG